MIGALLFLLVPVPGAIAAEQLPRLESVKCWFDDEGEPAARCYRLHVALSRSHPSAGRRAITLPVVVLPAATVKKLPDPLVYIEGGPGAETGLDADGIAVWRKDLAGNGVAEGRDLVLFDQRGAGRSEPQLDCPELIVATVTIYRGRPDVAATNQIWQKASAACRDRLLGEGVDLGAYDSAASAADLEDLRHALGYPPWNLWSTSYGTRVALVAMRDHPQGLRSAILDSVFPPEAEGFVDIGASADRVLAKIATECAADTACNGAYPQVAASLDKLVARLDATPIPVAVDGDDGRRDFFLLDGDRLLEVLIDAFYDWDAIAGLPRLIHEAANGNDDRLKSAASTYFSGLLDHTISDGLGLSVTCREEYPFEQGAPVAAAIRAHPRFAHLIQTDSTLAACPIWGVGRSPVIESQPVTSDVPALLLAGDYDVVTPPYWAEAAVRHLAHGHLVKFPGIGHGILASDTCADAVVAAFLKAPRDEPKPSCLSRLAGPLFKTR
jgi:pimeloyl-ACP methyl ester carboxylesterase